MFQQSDRFNMKRLATILFFVFLLIPIYSFSQEVNSEGREFYVVFPMNDSKEMKISELAVYITSKVDTKVMIEKEGSTDSYGFTVTAGETYAYSISNSNFTKDIEIDEIETIISKSIRIQSIEPISVFVFSDKGTSTEGYKAIPTEFWGDQYIHNSFFDFNEAREWAGGFSIIAKEDQTEVSVRIRDGANLVSGFGETVKGRKHGDIISFTLNSGQVYTVQGSGKTRGIFDLSGSHINSNKPVGVVSYHNRAMIPATVVNSGRDYLIEMLPPLKSWGTKYVSLELDRNTDKGDYFRVVAGSDNTTFNAKWYTTQGGGDNKQIGGTKSITLHNKGDWYEYNGKGAIMPHNEESIRGLAVFEADKPILVNQYSYSSQYDGNSTYDPFMTTLPSLEQFVNSAIFAPPKSFGSNEYNDNKLVLFAIGDSSNPQNNNALLSSIKLDDARVFDIQPNFMGNRIPATNIYWAEFNVNQGTHTLTGDTKFGGHLYGFSNFGAFAWPIAINYKKTNDPQSSVEISDLVNQFEVKLISENPTNNSTIKIRVIAKSTNKANFSISDISGRIVKQLGENAILGEKEFNLDIADLKSGVYFVTISADGMNRIIEFVVAR